MDHNYTKYRPLMEDDVVLVLGAFDGDFIREYKDEIISKNVTVINVEPSFELAKQCLEFANANFPPHKILVLNAACFDHNGTVTFETKNHALLNGIKGVETQWKGETISTSEVMCYDINTLIGIFDPHCIFCDIEGAELEVFQAMDKNLMDPGLTNLNYMAIAAYHMRDGEMTVHKLCKMFEDTEWEMLADEDESRKPFGDHVVLFVK